MAIYAPGYSDGQNEVAPPARFAMSVTALGPTLQVTSASADFGTFAVSVYF